MNAPVLTDRVILLQIMRFIYEDIVFVCDLGVDHKDNVADSAAFLNRTFGS
jgi:hypothetical protein